MQITEVHRAYNVFHTETTKILLLSKFSELSLSSSITKLISKYKLQQVKQSLVTIVSALHITATTLQVRYRYLLVTCYRWDYYHTLVLWYDPKMFFSEQHTGQKIYGVVCGVLQRTFFSFDLLLNLIEKLHRHLLLFQKNKCC